MERPRKLSATFIQRITEPGVYGDGRGGFGLSLRVKATANGRVSKTWTQRLRINGGITNIGLGKFPIVTLAEARKMAVENLRTAKQGKNPKADRIPTFAEAVQKVIEIYRPHWKNPRSADQWRATLRDYAEPKLGRRRIDQITTADVMACLTPHWETKTETMRRVLQRLSAIFKWSIAEGYRADNPAGDQVKAALPRNGGKKQNMKALPYAETGAAIEKIRQSDAYIITKLAFEFLVLTGTRSGETRGARWEEINLEGRVWIIPPERMKAGREFRIPLSSRAMEILSEAAELADGSELVFPSARGRALSDSTLSKLVRENGIPAVPHGFRSSLRDYFAEAAKAPREVAEAALAHVVGGTEGAYFRSDLFELRREVMEKWADFLNQS